MSDTSSNVVQINRTIASPSTDDLLLTLAGALIDRSVPRRRPLATGMTPTPEEGLALIGNYMTIADPELRQTLLDLLSSLSRPAGE